MRQSPDPNRLTRRGSDPNRSTIVFNLHICILHVRTFAHSQSRTSAFYHRLRHIRDIYGMYRPCKICRQSVALQLTSNPQNSVWKSGNSNCIHRLQYLPLFTYIFSFIFHFVCSLDNITNIYPLTQSSVCNA